MSEPVHLFDALRRALPVRQVGRIAEARGTLIRATGLQVAIGEQCLICDPRSGARVDAEVVGLDRESTLLTPLGTLEGLGTGARVVAAGAVASVPAGDALLGRVLDAMGRPIDAGPALPAGPLAPLSAAAPDPIRRRAVDRVLETGVRAIDALLAVGEGQRLGIFATAGGGKSTLLGMLARNAAADVAVVVLVGERGREVNEFLDDALGADGRARSVVVVATSDRPPLERARAVRAGTAIAEHFRAAGRHVLLLVDSVTRLARALRDVGLAVGEPPVRRGYPPSVFGALPALFERAGNDAVGSITAFYTVLAEDEDGDDPIVEEVRSILDGHIVLSRRLAGAGHFPAIDVAASASRVMSRIVPAEQLRRAERLRRLLAKYAEIEVLLQIGEYRPGGDPEADLAVQRMPAIRDFLRQPPRERTALAETLARLAMVTE